MEIWNFVSPKKWEPWLFKQGIYEHGRKISHLMLFKQYISDLINYSRYYCLFQVYFENNNLVS